MQSDSTEFQQLVDAARAGNASAIETIVEQYEPELLRVVRARLGVALRPYLDSVDVVQSVHKSVLFGLRDGKFQLQSSEHLVRLASMMVRRKIAKKWKRHRRQMRMDSSNTEACDNQSLVHLVLDQANLDPTQQVELNDRLLQLLDRFDGEDRKLLELRLEGFNTAEAARHLDVDPDSLRARLGRIRQKLKTSGVAADWI